ncbi:MAG: NADH-quinone oxidoreductase subunit NuoH [Phenylobacterium sp.]|nr:NADH-quinone oxidoreductase subunit NuoH [Phenylobacterium sp.]
MDPTINFWATELGWTLITVGKIMLIVLPLLVCLAFFMLADRKIWAGVQMRKGPNVVGPFGLLQSFADLIKFVLKELVIPDGADKTVFLLAPVLTFLLSLVGWAVIPFAPGWVLSNINVGVLYLFAISSLGVYGIIMGGWASNSKYPFLGALRSAAQMVSYEVSIGLVIITVILLSGSMNLTTIVEKQAGGFWNWNFLGGGLHNWPIAIVMFGMAVIFFISALAETNRPPFDLPEAESELVAGYQVEYSSSPFLLFMIGELVTIVRMCSLITVLFFGGWQAPIDFAFVHQWGDMAQGFYGLMWFFLKTCFFFFLIAMAKAIVPRYRYDQLMRLGWKVFLPTAGVAVVLVAAWRVFGPTAA